MKNMLLLLLLAITTIGYADIPIEHKTIIEEKPYRILGLGIPIIDLLIPVSEEFLATVPGKKGGAEEISYQLLENIISNNGITPKMATGGSCSNTMKGLASMGEKAALLGTVGQGEWSDYFTQTIQNVGVVPLLFPGTRSPATVLCMITPDKQRTMRFFEGCSRELTSQQLDKEYLKTTSLVHMEGYSLRNTNLVESMMKLAKSEGKLVSFDLCAFEIVNLFRKEIRGFIENGYIDILFANEDESYALTGLKPQESCRILLEKCKVVVILQGERGCLVGSSEGILSYSAIPTNVVDTTGAGDLFASGFLYGYINGYPLERCAYFGNLLGSSVVSVVGAEIPPEKWPELRKIIREE